MHGGNAGLPFTDTAGQVGRLKQWWGLYRGYDSWKCSCSRGCCTICGYGELLVNLRAVMQFDQQGERPAECFEKRLGCWEWWWAGAARWVLLECRCRPTLEIRYGEYPSMSWRWTRVRHSLFKNLLPLWHDSHILFLWMLRHLAPWHDMLSIFS